MPELIWNAEEGVGFFDCDAYLKEGGLPQPYDEAYFAKYHGYSETDLGRRLNDFRLKTVNKYSNDTALDVGIGSGQFITSRLMSGKPTVGYDVNPAGVAWLKAKDIFVDPRTTPVPVMTFFDSLEHIRDPAPLLRNITKFAVVSIPLFKDYKHVLNSKHFRKDEHFHYYTHQGFVSYMWNNKLRQVEYCDYESELGREGVRTYVFRKV